MAAGAILSAALAGAGTLDTDLIARKRVFPSVGKGVTAIHRDSAGRYFVLTERGGVQIFDAKEQPAGHAPADPSAGSAVSFGVDLDLDDQGRIYVADREQNNVRVFTGDGRDVRVIRIHGPTAVATLAGGELAVASLRAAKLVTVFGPEGQVVREFGEPEQISGRDELNRYANIGRLCRDASGRLYYSFTFLPEPTVRRYDRFGYSDFQLILNSEEDAASAMSARKSIAREEGGGKFILHVVLGPVAVDPANGEIWLAIGGRLLRFGTDGTERGSFLIFTPEELRIEASAILFESGRILVASSQLGIFDLPRPAAWTR
ncbi:MAG TPA: hypothetical protein VJW51_02590 [Candidatus Acidoferrales bacterium]|nr:hypothetical protein [Candidatus Acidoferrales bacterium]